MIDKNAFITPNEYMIAATFSGRIVFTSESLISFTGFDLSGRNLNSVFSDDVSAQILTACFSEKEYKGQLTFFGTPVSVNAVVEDDEILIFISVSREAEPSDSAYPSTNKISQELSSSLTVMSALLSNIAGSGDQNQDDIAMMYKQILKLIRLSKNISAYTSLQANTEIVNYKPYVLNDFISSIANRVSKLTCNLPVKITLDLPDEEVRAFFDAEKLRRAILNILTNAIASRRSSIDILISLHPAVNGNISLVIRDNGKGFNPTVFNSKSSSDDLLLSSRRGFGIPVSRAFLELHGGTMIIISDMDRGTAVNFNIPENSDKASSGFSAVTTSYSGSIDDILLELSPVLPAGCFMLPYGKHN